MLVILSVLIPGAATGAAAYFAARRWPASVVAPHLDTATIAGEVRRHSGLARLLQNRTSPAELTGLALSVAIAAIVLGIAGIGLLLAMIHSESGLARWDLSLARFGADHASPATTTFLRNVSQLGGYIGVILISTGVALLELRRTRTRTLAVVVFLLLANGGQFEVANLIKAIVNRARPAVLNLTGFSGASFPSGHATAAATTFMACALLLGRGRTNRQRAALVGFAVGIATAVASTRVLLGVHWLTDVLAGLLVGWGWFAVCSVAFGGRLLRFGAPIRQAEAIATAGPEQPPTRPRCMPSASPPWTASGR